MVISKVNSTAVRLNVALDGGNFDSGNVSFSPDTSDQTFDQDELPIVLSGLTSGVDYNLTFVFGVGKTTNCGQSGTLYSSPTVLKYLPGKNLN